MAKFTPTPLDSLQSEVAAINNINDNFDNVSEALENTLSRNGESPNMMEASLDMNSHRILNLPEPASGPEPLRLKDLQLINTVPIDGGVDGNGIIGRIYWDFNINDRPRLNILPHLTQPDPVLGSTDNPGGYKGASFRWTEQYDLPENSSGSRVYFNTAFSQDTDPSLVTSKRSNYLMSIIAYSTVPSGSGYNKPGQVSDVNRAAKGSGYTSEPTWVASGGGGTGASGHCTINNDGQVTSFVIDNGGSGYVSVPTIVISGGGGTGAAGTAQINGKNFWPQEVGPLNLHAVIASGNTSGKAEGIICLAGDEDETADGKKVVIQGLLEAHGTDPGWEVHAEDSDGDPTNAPDTYQGHILRANNIGTQLGFAVVHASPGKKFADQNGYSALGFYHGLSIMSEGLWQGSRDDGYDAGGDGISDEARAGNVFIHWDHSALNSWGWLGLGTDEPQHHLDVRTDIAGEIIEEAFLNNDTTTVDGSTVHRHRVYALTNNGTSVEVARKSTQISSKSNSSPNGVIVQNTLQDGTITTCYKAGKGLWVGNGGDPGANAIGTDALTVNTVGGIGTTGKFKGTAMAAARDAFAAATDIATLQAAAALMFE